jgi:hypothetical protein
MAGQIFRGMIYLFLAGALLMLATALAIDFGVYTLPIGFGWVVDLPPESVVPIKIGLIFLAIAAALFMAQRLWRQP